MNVDEDCESTSSIVQYGVKLCEADLNEYFDSINEQKNRNYLKLENEGYQSPPDSIWLCCKLFIVQYLFTVDISNWLIEYE